MNTGVSLPASVDWRPDASRGTFQTAWLFARFSFAFGSYQPPDRQSFGALRVLNEDTIQPGSGFAMHPHENLEILMLPLRGAIAHVDSLGNVDRIDTDEALLMSAGRGIRHSQMNASMATPDHHLQVWLFPRTQDTTPHIAKRSFPASGRQGHWQLLASPDGAADSLRIDQDARVLRAEVAGEDLGYEASSGRALYLHLVSGSMQLNLPRSGGRAAMQPGDAVAFAAAEPLILTGPGPADVLLIDLPPLQSV